MITKTQIYDELCTVLTDFEEGRADATDLYAVLLVIQSGWEDVITAAE